jgi:hypothetical protein
MFKPTISRLKKTTSVSFYMVMMRVHHIQRHGKDHFQYFFFVNETFPTISQLPKMKIVCKCYTLGKFKYQLATLGFIKLLSFNILVSCLGYTISKLIVCSLFIIVLINDTFPMVSQVTQIEIVCKS